MEGDAIPTPHQRRTQASRARAGTRGARPLCSPAVASYRQRPARFATGALVRDRGVLSYRAIPTSTAAKRILAARIARMHPACHLYRGPACGAPALPPPFKIVSLLSPVQSTWRTRPRPLHAGAKRILAARIIRIPHATSATDGGPARGAPALPPPSKLVPLLSPAPALAPGPYARAPALAPGPYARLCNVRTYNRLVPCVYTCKC